MIYHRNSKTEHRADTGSGSCNADQGQGAGGGLVYLTLKQPPAQLCWRRESVQTKAGDFVPHTP